MKLQMFRMRKRIQFNQSFYWMESILNCSRIDSEDDSHEQKDGKDDNDDDDDDDSKESDSKSDDKVRINI